MNDSFQEIEAELKRLRPAMPRREVEERVGRELSLPANGRVTQQLPAARRTQPRWSLGLLGVGLAGAACIVLCVLLWPKRVEPIQASNAASGAVSVPQARTPEGVRPRRGAFQQVRTANYLLSAQEEGIVYASATVPMRRIRYQFLDTAQWKGGDDHTVVEVIVPKEGTVLVPLNVH